MSTSFCSGGRAGRSDPAKILIESRYLLTFLCESTCVPVYVWVDM